MKGFDPTRWRVPLGFAAAVALIVLARPRPLPLAVGFVLGAAGLAVRAYASGHIRKNDELAIAGPYRFCRNPLYLGSLLLAAGFLVAAARWPLAVLALALFVGVYLPVIRREERYLAERFGPAFDAYAHRVPRLWPRWPSTAAPPGASFSWRLYRRHREYQALAGFLGLFLVLVLKWHWQGNGG